MVKKITTNSRKGINLNISFSNKTVYILIAILSFLIVGGIVYAYNSVPANPAVMGHSANELENVQYKIITGLTACSGTNQAIKTINPVTGAVTCETDDTGTGGTFTCETKDFTFELLDSVTTATATCSAGYTAVSGSVPYSYSSRLGISSYSTNSITFSGKDDDCDPHCPHPTVKIRCCRI